MAQNLKHPVVQELYYLTSVKVRLGEGIHRRAAA